MEEFMNILTHGIGIGIAIAGLVLLVIFASIVGDTWAIVSSAIFGFTMILLYVSSTFCHVTTGKKFEKFFEICDNLAIYYLIAGTYTPYTLTILRGPVGWITFGCIWGLAIAGTFLKFKYKDNQPKWTVLLYLFMGWFLIFIFNKLYNALTPMGFNFLLAGGFSYTIGILFYLWRKLKFSHAIWHLFVLNGTIMFFFSVLFGCILLR
jgi:hemolysin III